MPRTLCVQDATDAGDQARLDAAAAKRQAKLEKGAGKKKKGALARMKKGGAGAAADDDDDDDVPAVAAESENTRAQREAIKEREAEKDEKRKAREVRPAVARAARSMSRPHRVRALLLRAACCLFRRSGRPRRGPGRRS